MINRVTLYGNTPNITIVRKTIAVTVYSEELAMPTRMKNFSFTATQGQTTFVLDTVPVCMIALWIQGTGQDGENGDFTLTGKNIVLSEGVDSGTRIFGTYQEVAI